jgi:cytochrome c553
MFREKLRVVEVMTKTMQGLSDGDLRNMADTIAKLPQPAGGPAAPARMERARALIEKQHRCNRCHNRNYSGEQNVPRLAGRPWRKPELESAPF